MASENQPETVISTSPSHSIITLPPGPDAPATDAARSVPMPPTPEQPTGDWFDKVDWVLLGLVVVLSVLVSSVPAFNTDVWMQLGTGKLIAEGSYLPTGDEPFSCATEARDGHEAVRWINHSWLYSLILYLLYGALGGMGVIIVKASIIGALTIVLALIRTRDTHLFIVAICLTLTVLALSMRLLLQPVLVSYLLLGVTLLILHRAGVFEVGAPEESTPGRARWLWALPLSCVLWVNFDNWFVLGPIVVGLAWAGTALQSWRGQACRVPAGRLGTLFGVCLLACLVNPFHARAFQLPPELAYLFVRTGDRIGVSLPNALVAGGRTLAILHDAEPERPTTQPVALSAFQRHVLSPFAQGYLSNRTLGYTIAGASFFPLLGLGLVSFLLTGILGARPGGPVYHPTRFLVWFFFAVLASLLHRLIPFFVIVAGPITALNLGDLLAWYSRPTADDPSLLLGSPSVRLGRLIGVLVLVVLLLLAWPGWLTGPLDVGGRLHVGWDIPVDVSLRRAVEQLDESAEAHVPGGPARVFSTGPDYSCYGAYFAGPDKVKSFMDARYNLFPQAAADFVKARQALFDKPRHPKSEWTSVFETYRLNYAAVENFLSTPVYISWWAEPAYWRQRFADRSVAVFAWSSKQQPWPGDAVLDGWNRLAFGPIRGSERPGLSGLSEPQNRGLFERYLEPPPPLPQAALDMDLKLAFGQFMTPRAVEVAQLTLPGAGRAQVMPMYSLWLLPLQPGAINAPWAMTSQIVLIQELKTQVVFWAALDPLPPAVPILAMRRAWHVAADAPDNERCYIYLANAVGRLQRQEDYWVNPFGPAPLTLRAGLRRAQVVSALRAAAEVGIVNPALQYQVYQDLAREYSQRHAFDLSAEYLGLAEQALDATMPDDPRLQEEWRKVKKQIGEFRKGADLEVKQRRTSFDLRTADRKPMEKIKEAAFGTYRQLDKDNVEQVDPQGWGLMGMTLRLLDDLDPLSLPPEDQSLWGYLSIDLMFKTGQARQASQLLAKFETPLAGPRGLRFRVFRAGTQGNYQELAKVLKDGDDMLAAEAGKQKRLAFAASGGLLATPGLTAPLYTMASTPHAWLEAVKAWRLTANELFNTRTLRAMIALEAGDTGEATHLLTDVLREAGGDFYTERAIAERYATFLARYQPR